MGDPGKSIHALGSSLEHKKGTEFLLPFLEPSDKGEEHTKGGQESRNQRKDHEKGKETSLGKHSEGQIANLEEENRERLGAQIQKVEVMKWEKGTEPGVEKSFEFRMAPKTEGNRVVVGLGSVEKELGPMAMCFDEDMGWVAETLGPKSGHWKLLAKEAHGANKTKETKEKIKLGKRHFPSPLQELDPNCTTQKRRKHQEESIAIIYNEEGDGGEAMAAVRHHRAS